MNYVNYNHFLKVLKQFKKICEFKLFSTNFT
jgi:hypothetical protein